MKISKISDNRWIVRDGKNKALGFVELHSFVTYKGKRRVKDEFWIGRLFASGWKETKPIKCATKEQALAFVKLKGKVAYQDRKMAYKPKRKGDDS